MLHGTDISAFQPEAVPAGDFVIIKATQGTAYTNSKLKAQLADARRKGLLVGFYHFPAFGNDPLADGKHFCDVVAPLLKPGDKVVLDHETYPPPSASHAAAWGLKFLAYTEKRAARRPWVYANVDWASGGYCAGMGAYPYWCADPSSPAGKPRVRGPFKTWIAHQYGISGMDRDVFNGTRADWLGSSASAPTEDNMLSGKISVGKGEKDPIVFPIGPKTLLLGWDNTYENAELGITRQPPAHFRIANHQKGRKGVTEKDVKVGAELTDKGGWADNVPVTLPSNCDRIDIVRLDDGDRPVGFSVS